MFPTKIFLDLDDVLNRFTMHALAYVGCPVDVMDDSICDPVFGFDIIARANELHPTREFTYVKFWGMFNFNAWANVPPSDELEFLLDSCIRLVDKENICILTAPIVTSPGCLEGKLSWIHNYLPSWLHKQYLIGPLKYFCARPDALLIDDADHNVDAFRAYGGQALLVPRPWNSLHECHTMKYLQETFDVLARWKHHLPMPGHRPYTW